MLTPLIYARLVVIALGLFVMYLAVGDGDWLLVIILFALLVANLIGLAGDIQRGYWRTNQTLHGHTDQKPGQGYTGGHFASASPGTLSSHPLARTLPSPANPGTHHLSSYGAIPITSVRGAIICTDEIYKPAIVHEGIKASEVIGWRAWQFMDGPRLKSIVTDYVWEPGPQEAEIRDAPSFVYPGRDPLTAGLGFFALKDPHQLSHEMGSTIFSLGTVVGTIEMWGEIVEHEHGYRSQFAKVRHLCWAHGNNRHLDELRKYYGVEGVEAP